MVDKKMEDTEEIEELANNQTFKRYIFMWSGQLFHVHVAYGVLDSYSRSAC